MTKILILAGDGGEALEILYPKFRLEEEGWDVSVVAVKDRPIRSVIHDFEPGFDTYTEKPGYLIPVSDRLEDVRPDEFDALVIPGGRAPEYLRNLKPVQDLIQHFVDHNKPIAVTCHGPLMMITACQLTGRQMTCYPELAFDLKAAGIRYVDSPTVIDGNIVSARAWPDNGPWMREFVRLVRTTSSTG